MLTNKRVVHILDDDASVLRSLKCLLQVSGYEVSTYDSPSILIEAANTLDGGCILIDLRMPGMDGLQLYRHLLSLDVSAPVILISGQGDIPTAVKALKSGVVDFIEKPFDDRHLLEAIENAFLTNVHADTTRESIRAARKISALTPREKQVLEGLVSGQANKAIAYDLGISVRTVELHRTHLLDRLGTRRLAGAIRLSVLASLAQVR